MQFFQLTVSETDAQNIWNALMELPAKTSYQTLQSMQAQLTPQGAFGPVAPPPPPADDKTLLAE